MLGSLGRGIAYIIMYIGILTMNIWVFGLGTFFLGFSVAQFWPPFDALISQKSYKTKRSTAFGRRFGLIGLGNLVGSILSITIFTLADDFLWVQYFPLIIFCVANIYAGLIFYKRVDESQTFDDLLKNGQAHEEIMTLNGGVPVDDQELNNRKIPKEVISAFLVFAIVIFFAAVNQTIADPFTQPFVRSDIIPGDELRSILNDDDLYIMLVYAPGPLLAQILSPLLGRYADKVNISRGMPIISALGATFTAILIFLPTGWSFGLLLLVDITFALSGNLIFQNFLSRVSKAHRGKMFAMFSWVSRVGATIGPIIGGLVYDTNHRIPFIISIFAELLLIPFFLLSFKLLKPHLVEKVAIDVKIQP
jgi:MFS family permease